LSENIIEKYDKRKQTHIHSEQHKDKHVHTAREREREREIWERVDIDTGKKTPV